MLLIIGRGNLAAAQTDLTINIAELARWMGSILQLCTTLNYHLLKQKGHRGVHTKMTVCTIIKCGLIGVLSIISVICEIHY